MTITHDLPRDATGRVVVPIRGKIERPDFREQFPESTSASAGDVNAEALKRSREAAARSTAARATVAGSSEPSDDSLLELQHFVTKLSKRLAAAERKIEQLQRIADPTPPAAA